MATELTEQKKVIFFDGVCNLCNGFVDFVIQRDHHRRFLFSSLQGPSARSMLSASMTDRVTSIVLLENGKTYIESDAVLRILTQLGGLWAFMALCHAVPAPLRDSTYRWIAANRYRWFGQKDSCRIPSPEERSRFLP